MSKKDKKKREKYIREKQRKRRLLRKVAFFCAAVFCFAALPFIILSSAYRTAEDRTASAGVSVETQPLQFGTYPQSAVEDREILAALGNLPLDWTYYDDCHTGAGFYGTMEQTNCMKYADTELDGNRYRAVMIEQYRPDSVLSPAVEEESRQDDNGFLLNEICWFRFEPIRWIVLDENTGLVMSESVLDAMPFNDSYYWVDRDFDKAPFVDRELSATKNLFTPANLYKTSSVRKWLNNRFYDEAFTKEEKRALRRAGHLAHESAERKKYGLLSLSYDRIFLPSFRDIANYSGPDKEAATRLVPVTDYARCRGAYTFLHEGEYYTWYWLSSPGDGCADVLSVSAQIQIINSDRQFYYAHSLGGIRCAAFFKPDAFDRPVSE